MHTQYHCMPVSRPCNSDDKENNNGIIFGVSFVSDHFAVSFRFLFYYSPCGKAKFASSNSKQSKSLEVPPSPLPSPPFTCSCPMWSKHWSLCQTDATLISISDEQQVWYFIAKNQLGLRRCDPLKSSPGSHSLLVSDSIGTMSSCSLLRFHSRSASHRLVYAASASQYPSLTRNCGRLLTVATQSSLAEVDSSKVTWQQCTWRNYCACDKCRCTKTDTYRHKNILGPAAAHFVRAAAW